MPVSAATDGRRRVVIENVQPAVDDGRFAVKRVVNDPFTVTADVFADGHEIIAVRLLHRKAGATAWIETPMTPTGNDAWQASFELAEVGCYEYAVIGWTDAFDSWRHDLEKRVAAGQDVGVDLQIGGQLVVKAVTRAGGEDGARLRHWHAVLASGGEGLAEYQAGEAELAELMAKYPDRSLATESEQTYRVTVDAPKARFSTWYELFPRSCASEPGKHGTLADVIDWLPRIEALGFDVLYLPPIHPIGTTFRKGKNNRPAAEPGDVGSPWAIGSAEGGHLAIHPPLGTLADFHRLVEAARARGIDVALDVAFQCSPDHPYVKEHPQWFRQRPDGTVQYAENPPKKYQDIYPFDFETSDWQALWRELTGVFLYWAEQGVRIFRVDNPHTKPFAFWEFLIGEVKAKYPEAIFLSEAFTRPKIMYRLAKLGFTQSYTYFTWRNTQAEFIEYFTELTQTEVSEFFRPNLWPNTPDILPPHLQTLGRPSFIARLVLAATLGANYGMYGPAYEALEHEPREPGSEEYLNSEKYELRHWDLDRPEALGDVIAAVNRIRRENSALHDNASLRFHPTDNDRLLCYSKLDTNNGNRIVTVVNLGLPNIELGFVYLQLPELGIDPARPYQLHELLSGASFNWQGSRNFVKLEPRHWPAHVFRVQQA